MGWQRNVFFPGSPISKRMEGKVEKTEEEQKQTCFETRSRGHGERRTNSQLKYGDENSQGKPTGWRREEAESSVCKSQIKNISVPHTIPCPRGNI